MQLQLCTVKVINSCYITILTFILSLFIPRLVLAQNTNWGQGPIELGDQQPLALIHSSISPTSPETVRDSQLKFRSSFAWSNTLNRRKNTYLIDAETRVTEFQVDYGLTNNAQLGLRLPIVYRGEGILDPIIDDWHRIFGLPRGKRDKVADNRFALYGVNDDGSVYEISGSGVRLSNLTLDGKLLLSSGDDTLPAWSIFGAASLPTGARYFSHQGVDLTLGTVISKRWDDFVAYLGGGYLYFGDSELDDLQYAHHHISGFVTAEYAFTNSLAVEIGLLSSSALLHNASKFPDYSLYLDIGALYAITQKIRAEFLIRENPAPRDGTVDITALLGFSYLASL